MKKTLTSFLLAALAFMPWAGHPQITPGKRTYEVSNFNLYVTNLFAHITYITNLYVNQSSITNLYVENEWVTNLYANTTYVTNLYVTNLTVQNIDITEGLTVDGDAYPNKIITFDDPNADAILVMNRINVQSYGATDGGADDTAAFQAAVDAAENATNECQTIYVPFGAYDLTNTITIDDSITIVGDGPWETIIRASSSWGAGTNAPLFYIEDDDSSAEQGGGLQALRLESGRYGDYAPYASGVKATGWGLKFDDLFFLNYNDYAIHLAGDWQAVEIENSLFYPSYESLSSPAVQLGASSFGYNMTIFNNVFQSPSGDGTDTIFESASTLRASHIKIDSCYSIRMQDVASFDGAVTPGPFSVENCVLTFLSGDLLDISGGSDMTVCRLVNNTIDATGSAAQTLNYIDRLYTQANSIGVSTTIGANVTNLTSVSDSFSTLSVNAAVKAVVIKGDEIEAPGTNLEIVGDVEFKDSIQEVEGVAWTANKILSHDGSTNVFLDFDDIADGIGWNPENVVVVSPSGGDYTTIQAALNANAVTNLLVLVGPGVYANDTINFTANYQCVKNLGKPNVARVTNTAQICEAGDFGPCSVIDMNLVGTYTSDINLCEVNDGDLRIRQCRLQVNASGTISSASQPQLLAVTGTGDATTKLGEFYLYNTATTTTGIKTAFEVANGGELYLKRPCKILVSNSGTATATAVYADTGTGVVDIENACEISVTDTDASIVAGLGYVVGSGSENLNYSTVTVTGGGANNCYGIYHAGTGTISSEYNKITVTGGANNYSYFVGASATLDVYWDLVSAADGRSVAGTFNGVYNESTGDLYVSDDSDFDGDLDVAGALTASGSFDAGGATSHEIKNSAADVALANAGEIHLNTTDEQLGFHSADDGEISGEAAISLLIPTRISFDPKAVCDGDVDRIFLLTIGDEAPEGITIVEWKVSFEADPTTEADLDLKYADAFIGVANAQVIDVCDTTNGVASADTNADINGGSAVANGKVLYLEFGTAYTEENHQMIFEMWHYNEED